MNIFITGSSGFVGYHVLKNLIDKKHNLLILQNEKGFESDFKIKQRIIVGNLNKLKSIKADIKCFSPDICMHFAWEGIPDYSENISKKNLNNSIELCDFLVNETNCGKIIVSGSCFEYGQTVGVCNEEQQLSVNSFFSWAKSSLYNYLTLLCKNKGVRLFWGRIFYVYGPRQRIGSLIPAMVDSLMKGQSPQINKPLNANDFVYVEDIAEAFCMAAEADIPSGAYNLGSGKSTEVIRICQLIEKGLFRHKKMSDEIISKTNSQQELNFWADTSKTKEHLGWYAQTDIQKGISQYLKFIGAVK